MKKLDAPLSSRMCTTFAGTKFEKPDDVKKVVNFKEPNDRYDISARMIGGYVIGSKRDDINFQIWDNNGQQTTAIQQTAEAIVQQWKGSALKKNAKLETPTPSKKPKSAAE